jgi:hypothetical protein
MSPSRKDIQLLTGSQLVLAVADVLGEQVELGQTIGDAFVPGQTYRKDALGLAVTGAWLLWRPDLLPEHGAQVLEYLWSKNLAVHIWKHRYADHNHQKDGDPMVYICRADFKATASYSGEHVSPWSAACLAALEYYRYHGDT